MDNSAFGPPSDGWRPPLSELLRDVFVMPVLPLLRAGGCRIPCASAPRFRWFLASAAAALTLVAAAGCAAPPPQPPAMPAPGGDVAALEGELAGNPASVSIRVRLGAAYREAGRLEEARTVLEPAARAEPLRASVTAQLGLTLEALEEPAAARALYDRYRSREGASDEMVRWIDARGALLRRLDFRVAAREAAAQEATLAQVPPDPARVAVLPFRAPGAASEFELLGRALAEFTVTDLSVTDRLTVLERLRVQALLDELSLPSERVDPGTAARSGRLLAAGRVVLGALEVDADEVVRLAGAVVGVEGEGQTIREFAPDAGPLEAIFDAQKDFVLSLYGALGVELTEAEREQVLRRPTTNLQALLAFGAGLAAEDDGDFQEAAARFQEAVQLDPGFDEARIRAGESESVSGVASTPPASAAGEEEDDADLPVDETAEDVAEEEAPADDEETDGAADEQPDTDPAGDDVPGDQPGTQEGAQEPGTQEGTAGSGGEAPPPPTPSVGVPDPFGAGGSAGGNTEATVPDSQVRDAVAEATGNEGIGRTAILRLIIRRP